MDNGRTEVTGRISHAGRVGCYAEPRQENIRQAEMLKALLGTIAATNRAGPAAFVLILWLNCEKLMLSLSN